MHVGGVGGDVAGEFQSAPGREAGRCRAAGALTEGGGVSIRARP